MSYDKRKSQRFPETSWSLVGRAAASDELTRQKALTELLTTYMPGLRSFLIEGRHISPDLADDILHDFVVDKVLVGELVHHADHEKGKFRNFVLKALNNFASSKLRREYATREKVTGMNELLSAPQSSRQGTERFEQEWVRQVVRDALQLMEADCRNKDRDDLWKIFCLRVVDPMLQNSEPADYEEIIRQLGVQTPRQAMNLLANGKRCFERHLRTAVGRYINNPDQIDEEIADLREIVGR